MSTAAVRARLRPVVALDVIAALLPAGGIGRYVRDLADALATRPDAPASEFVFPRRLPGHVVPSGWDPGKLRPIPWGSRKYRLLTALGPHTGPAVDRDYGWPAALHLPVGYGPRLDHAALLMTAHDHTALTHPEWHPARLNLLVRASAPALFRRAHRVVCDSEFVRRQTIELFRLDPTRVTTVHLPVGEAFRPVPPEAARAHLARQFGLREAFVLHVGTFEPRKNHVGLALAFARLRQAGFRGRLVMVGRDGWKVGPIHARLAASPEFAAHLILRQASDADLAALYSACEMLVFPSFDEGFGFPPLEAMACGAAVIAADRSSLPEVVGDAGVLVDPDRPEAIAEAMISLWRDPARRAELGAQGIRRAAGFDRERWIETMFGIYRDLLAVNS